MDIDLISPLPLEECQKRLDAALVHYSVQVPLWNWPPRKMAGSRSGMGFTLDPRPIQYNAKGGGGPQTKMLFSGLLSKTSSGTQIRGSFDTEALNSLRSRRIIVSLIFTIFICVITSFDLSLHNIQGFNWPFALCLIGISAVLIALSIYLWNKRATRPNPPGKKKVKRFLELMLDAKEALVQ